MKFPQLSLFRRLSGRLVSVALFRVFIYSTVFFTFLLLPFSLPSPCRADGPAWDPILETGKDANGRLYVITSEKGGLFASDNGGKRWKHLGGRIPPSNLFSLRISPGGRLFLSTFDELLVSSDGGQTWKSMKGGGSIRLFFEGSGGTFLAVDWDRGLLWATKENPKFEKARGGTGEFAILDVLDGGTQGKWAASFGGGVLFSADEGRTWRSDDDGLTNQFVLCLAWAPETKTLFAGALEGGVYRKEAGGNWTPSSGGLPPGVSVQAMAAGDGGVVWAGTRGRGLYVSRDGGRYWYPRVPGEEGKMSVTSIVPFRGGVLAGTSDRGLFFAENDGAALRQLLPSDPVVGLDETGRGEIVALSRSGNLYVSSDGGLSWRSAGSTGGRMPAASILSQGRRLFAGVKDGLILSEDGGKNWTRLAFPSDGPPFTMISTADGGLLAATGSGGLFRSSDGFLWQRVEGLEGEYIYSMGSPDGITIAAGTDRGFSVSGDGGKTWKNTYINYGIRSLAFSGPEMIWGCSRNGFWGYSTKSGEVEEAEIAGYEWSPLAYFSEVFSGEREGSLFALLGGSLVRLVPGEGKKTFTMETADLSNAEVLASLRIPRGGMLFGTGRGFFRSGSGTSWTEIELP